jgi:hypothetical protein
MVVSFDEHDLRNTSHKTGIQQKQAFDHNNPELFIKHDYTEMSIYALHDAGFWNRLHTYVQQKIIQYTL